ncbi:hypothetical protein EVG20_g3714 [Dentipellis fragilis]|uniref:DUF3752 domain-containing protein n=1 Tax=Dentipellis fragilis TaxID=205917 RepID=A0A4Y9Z3Q5_9AGAM|nr:hypothetical protein EVG20_g3714 [Dentipellis fragilis]
MMLYPHPIRIHCLHRRVEPRATRCLHVLTPAPRYEEEEEEEEEDDYAPMLPPDLAAARAGPSRRILGPARGPQREEEEESEDEEVGPARYLRGTLRLRTMECEAAKPKKLQRDEWMLKPPSSSDLLATLDPTKLSKPRQFSRSTAPPKKTDNTLWTETPAERQQRLADEVLGKKRRIENADPAELEAEEDARKRRKRDAELKREVEEHTVRRLPTFDMLLILTCKFGGEQRKHRGPTLLDAHADADPRRKKDTEEEPVGIWDHSRDMSLGGRLMDDKDRRKMIQDARGLSDRFGSGRSGGFL